MSKNTNDFSSALSGLSKFVLELSRVLKEYNNWYKRNSKTIATYISAFIDFGIWCYATEKLAENQIVFTDELSFEFAEKIYYSNNILDDIKDYYFSNNEKNFNRVVARCKEAKQISDYSDLYIQIIDSYKKHHYHLACIGLFALVDGVLADVSGMITTGVKQRIIAIEEKLGDKIELNDIDKKVFCIYSLVDSFDKSIFCNESFGKNEPDGLNRHWVIHGRTRKTYDRIDFLKILLWLDAIIFLSDLSN